MFQSKQFVKCQKNWWSNRKKLPNRGWRGSSVNKLKIRKKHGSQIVKKSAIEDEGGVPLKLRISVEYKMGALFNFGV